MYKVVDLFAGAGGLSLGFRQTGKFDIKAAFENNPAMQRTYSLNHAGVEMYADVCRADYNAIKDKFGSIDVVIGGPPCQGFSNANRQKNHAVSMNNRLVKEYVRAIRELSPKAFVMENVGMLKSDLHRFFVEEGDELMLSRYGIKTQTKPFLLIEKGWCEGHEAELIDLLKDPEQIKKHLWPEKHYQELNIVHKAIGAVNNKLTKVLEGHIRPLQRMLQHYLQLEGDDYISVKTREAFAVLGHYYQAKPHAEWTKISTAVKLQRMLTFALELYSNHIKLGQFAADDKGLHVMLESYAVLDYIQNTLRGMDNGYELEGQVLCAADYGAPQKRERFIMIGVRRDLQQKPAMPGREFTEDNYRTVHDAIADLQEVAPFYELEEDRDGIDLRASGGGKYSGPLSELRDCTVLKNHIAVQTTPRALERFKAIAQGQNFHNLDASMVKDTYTNVERTQRTIYLRLNYAKPSGTVVNVRKSMWIHPVKDRSVTIREAARLQTFPDSFVFTGSKDKQFQQVGNAVPPMLANAIARQVAKLLQKAGCSAEDGAESSTQRDAHAGQFNPGSAA